jgi:drug/metabolite transporter (DMT)-like permease
VPPLRPARAYLALVLIVILWGTYPVTAKLALTDFPPVFLAALRATVAAVFLAALLYRAGADSVRTVGTDMVRAFVVLGLVGIAVSTNLSYVALYFSTASSVVLLQAAGPVMVALAARAYLGERLATRQWAGVAVSSLGVILVITQGQLTALRPEDLRPGDLVNLVGLAGWSLFTVYGKRVLAVSSPLLATAGAYVVGAAVLLPTALVVSPFFPAPRLGAGLAWTIVFYQALVGAVAHLWWYKAVEVVGASRSAIFMNLQPVVGLVLAMGLLGEQLGVWELVGGALVLGGVALTTRGG